MNSLNLLSQLTPHIGADTLSNTFNKVIKGEIVNYYMKEQKFSSKELEVFVPDSGNMEKFFIEKKKPL